MRGGRRTRWSVVSDLWPSARLLPELLARRKLGGLF